MRIYLCPALMDWLVFLVHFGVLYGAGERRLSMVQCAWLGGVFQLAYLSVSLMIGHVLTRRNARGFLLCSTSVCLVLAVVCIMATRTAVLLTGMGMFGVAMAIFFNAFQTFMRGEAAPGSLARTVGIYTLAWSSGASFGFLSAGYFYQLGQVVLAGVSVVVSAAVVAILLHHRARPADAPSADEHVEQGTASSRPVNETYVWVGWVIMFTGMFVQRPLHTFFPSMCAREGVSSFAASLPLFLQMLIQGITGALLWRYREMLYRRTPLWLFQGGGVLALLVCWRWPSYAVCLAGISLMGIYYGFAFFAGVYYASNSGRRSFNIGVNECLVGVGSFTGLFVAEYWMKQLGNDAVMYLVCAAALAISALIQVGMGSLRRGWLVSS